MKRRTSLSLILSFSLFASVAGQTPSPAPQQQDEDVVRITTNLVQVDAVVTDSAGRQVTDLKPEDFEITEDGKAQPITNFSYVAITPTNAPATAAAPVVTNVAGVQPARVRPQDVRRTIVIVIDDLGMSFESMSRTRSALKRFVEQQMQPGDLISIVRTSGGTGALQQFTTDKTRLEAVVSKLRWNPNGRGGVVSVNLSDRKDLAPTGPNTVVETLKSLNFIISGLKTMPGRKSLFLISDSFTIFESTRNIDLGRRENGTDKPSAEELKQPSPTEDPVGKMLEKRIDAIEDNNVFLSEQRQLGNPVALLASLIENANRASVVIYTIDPRGLESYSPSAETGSKGIVVKDTEPVKYGEQMQNRSQKFWETQVGLGYVAKQTGGFLISNTNDIGRGLERIMNDLKGYYLIGYRPSDETFGKSSAKRFHSINIRVKRAGLKVRSRNGFYGVTEEERRGLPKSRSEILLAALNSPFQAGDINMRLTSLFSNDPRSGSFMRSTLYVDVSGFSFKPDAEGWQTASMEVLAMTFSDTGEEIDKMARAETLQAKGATFQRLLRNGLVYSFDIPIKKPGSYQLRIAVRDPATDRIGTATQLIEVPDLSKGRLALSGINARVLATATAAASSESASAETVGLLSAPPKIGGGDAALDEGGAQPNAAARRLRRGMALDYSFVIFNARRAMNNNQPQLKVQLRLLRDGQLLWTKEGTPPDDGKQQDATRLVATGQLEITPEMEAGEYVLQVIVTDTLANGTASQWIDFEVIK